MQKDVSFRALALIGVVFCLVVGFLAISTSSSAAASSFSPALRRYPYLSDAVGQSATINWATDRSGSTGSVSYGKSGSESCTAHSATATKTAISVNGVSEYQWKTQLTLQTGTQYCYRVFLGTTDLLGSDASPSFRTQLSSKATQSFSFVVLGDWGQVDSSGANPSQAKLMSLIASSGARFALTVGDNGYPAGSQTNFGDLIQTGSNISAIFGPSFWKVPGASLPLFIAQGNHGIASTDPNNPALLSWPEDRATSTSTGRFQVDTYCCLDGTTSASYPTVWYAFNAGPARFYVLDAAWSDTNIGTAANPYQVDFDYHWASGTAQNKWLKADLAAHPSGLKFVFLHYPIHSDSPTQTSDVFLQGSNSAEGLFKQNGVDIVFTGHAHIYERNRAGTAGVINYVTGGGGATLGTLSTCSSVDAYALGFTTTGKACGSAPVPTSADQVFHFLKVTVNGTNVTVTPINALGKSFDVMSYSFATAIATSTPTPTQSVATPTRTPTASSTATAAAISTRALLTQNLPAITGTTTCTPTPTNEPSATGTPTTTPLATVATPIRTIAPEKLPVATDAATSTPTPTSQPSATSTLTIMPTTTPTCTPIPTASPAVTSAPTGTPTSTNRPPAIGTPTATATSSPIVALSPTVAPAATVSSRAALTFIGEADSHIDQASPTTNFGTSTTLQSKGGSGGAQISFIRFTVKGTHDTIQDVRLRVFCIDGVAHGPAVYLADNNWIESGAGAITWNNQPQLLSGEIDKKDALGRGAWVEYDVSSVVTGDGTYTLALINNGTEDATFSSREGSAPPQLVVTFSP